MNIEQLCYAVCGLLPLSHVDVDGALCGVVDEAIDHMTSRQCQADRQTDTSATLCGCTDIVGTAPSINVS